MLEQKLFMAILGCTPSGRRIEQHDIFFGIGTTLESLIPEMKASWPEAMGNIHLDAWREVAFSDGYRIRIIARGEKFPTDAVSNSALKLFFINLGGYKENEFEEFHYKCLVVGADKGIAIRKAKQTAFYQHYGFEGATSHVDDKYGIDVDDFHQIEDILPADTKEKFTILVEAAQSGAEDVLHIGYVKLSLLPDS